MEVKLNWTVLTDRMYTVAPTGKSRSNYMRCCSIGLPGAAKRIPMRRKHTAVRFGLLFRLVLCGCFSFVVVCVRSFCACLVHFALHDLFHTLLRVPGRS